MPEPIMRTGADRSTLKVRRGKILLVDEDAGDLQLYTSPLRDQGHNVDDCTTYLEGAQRLERGRYDLVVLSQGGQTFQWQPLLERAIELDRRREDFLVFAVVQKSETQRSQRMAHRAHGEEKTVWVSFSVIPVGLLSVTSVLEAFWLRLRCAVLPSRFFRPHQRKQNNVADGARVGKQHG